MSLVPGVHAAVVIPLIFQIGAGPSPAPAPAGPTSSTVPKTNANSTITVVPTIKASWTLVCPWIGGPSSSSPGRLRYVELLVARRVGHVAGRQVRTPHEPDDEVGGQRQDQPDQEDPQSVPGLDLGGRRLLRGHRE